MTILLIVLLSPFGMQQSRAPVLFGVDLQDGTLRLLEQVEARYGKPIREEVIYNWEPTHYGESSVDPDGAPRIRVNDATGRSEVAILHELFHLKLLADGYPIIDYEFPPGQMTSSNAEFVRWIKLHLYDPMLHWVFYPEMRKMGIEPDNALRAEFLQAIRQDDFFKLNPATAREARVLYYLKAKLQLDDPDLLHRVTEWYQRKGWIEDLQVGDRLYRWIAEADRQRPEELISAFIKSLNELLQGIARFELAGWQQVTYGSFLQKVVTIRILPSATIRTVPHGQF